MRMRGKKPIFSRSDCWSMDSVLKPIIGEGVKAFRLYLTQKKEKEDWWSVPSNLYSQEYGNIDHHTIGMDDDDDKSFHDWVDILQKIEYAFLAEEPDYKGELKHVREQQEDGSVKYSFSRDVLLWEEYCEECREHEEKVKEGLRLFSIFFNGMWV